MIITIIVDKVATPWNSEGGWLISKDASQITITLAIPIITPITITITIAISFTFAITVNVIIVLFNKTVAKPGYPILTAVMLLL